MGRGGGKGTRTRWNRKGGRGDRVCRGRRSARVCRNWPQGRKTTMPRDGCAGRGRAARRWPSTTLTWWRRWERLVDPATRGDPTGPLRWTCSSAARLSRELQEAGHRVSERSVNRLLHALGYSLQANRKTLEGKQHPDRDAQFNHINRRVRAFQRRRQPVVSVDTKKKELVGPFEERGAGVASARSAPSRFGSTTFRTRPSARRFRTACTT